MSQFSLSRALPPVPTPRTGAITHPLAGPADSARGSAREPPRARGAVIAGAALYPALVALLGGAWLVARLGLYQSGDDVGYWLGVAGAVAMLLLFSYPLRKYVRVLHGWGKVKWWFVAHMILGVAGPLLILLHSTFRVGSLNAAVALGSMLVVAASGVVGRFIYLHVHRGLSGEKQNLRRLESRAGLDRADTGSRLRFAPEVEAGLRRFAERELRSDGERHGLFDRVALLPLRATLAAWRCAAALRKPLQALARERGWSPSDHRQRGRLARKLVRRYLRGVVRVAQFSAYERLFALWHMAHVPFVWLMLLSAVVHVIAVHAY